MEKYPPATLAIVGISIVVYLLGALGWQDIVVRPLLISEYIKPTLPELYSGQIWRLFTPMFLHFSIFHIVFNMLWTLEFGRLIESRQGAAALILISLGISASSNLAQYFISGPIFGGMSGVIYGYFGYVWIQSLTNPGFGIRLNPTIVKLLLGWFVVCWSGILELFGITIANTAHTAGLLSGMGLALTISGIARISRK
jgi:GlpG protein